MSALEMLTDAKVKQRLQYIASHTDESELPIATLMLAKKSIEKVPVNPAYIYTERIGMSNVVKLEWYYDDLPKWGYLNVTLQDGKAIVFECEIWDEDIFEYRSNGYFSTVDQLVIEVQHFVDRVEKEER